MAWRAYPFQKEKLLKSLWIRQVQFQKITSPWIHKKCNCRPHEILHPWNTSLSQTKSLNSPHWAFCKQLWEQNIVLADRGELSTDFQRINEAEYDWVAKRLLMDFIKREVALKWNWVWELKFY